MDKLFKMMERGETPTFIEVLAALNEVSDIDWDRVEASLLTFPDVLTTCKVSNTPKTCDSESCAVCG